MLDNRFNLAVRTLMVLLPVVVAAVIAIYLQNQREISTIEQTLEGKAISTLATVDRHLASQIAVLQSMSVIKSIETGDLNLFRETMHRIRGIHNGWLAISLLNATSAIVTTHGDTESPIRYDSHGVNTVFQTAQPSVSGVFRPGAYFAEPFYIIRVPVMQGELVRYVLSAAISAWSLHETLAKLQVMQGGRIEVMDRDSNIIARSISRFREDPLVGHKPSATLVMGASRPGIPFFAVPHDGPPAYGIAMVHPEAGWRVIVTAPQMVLDAPRMEILIMTGGGAVIALLLTASVGTMLIWTMDRRAAAERRVLTLEAEAARREATDRLQIAFEAGRVGAFERDIEKNIFIADHRTRTIFGFADDEIVDLTRVRRMVHPEDIAAFDGVFRTAGSGASDVIAIEYRIVMPDGMIRWVDVRGRAIFDAHGERRSPARILGAVVDVTESRAAAHALRESEQRLRLGAQVARFGTFEVDPRTGALAWSAEMYPIFGIAPGTPIDFPMAFAMTHPDDMDALAAMREEYLRPDGPEESAIAHRIVRPDGAVRWIDKRIRVIRGTGASAGVALRVVGAVQDITERREAMDALAEANAELERRVAERTEQLVQTQKMEAIGQLTAGVAHDFNNVLQGVSSCFAAMERRVVDAHTRALFDAAQDGIQRGARLTQHLLAFARRQTLSPKPTSMTDMLEAMRPILERSMGGLIRIGIEVADDAWPAQVDPTQIEVAVLNLAINARDAMPLGGMLALKASNATVRGPADAGAPPDLAPGEYVVVSVSDNGSGMDDATLSHVFEPFFTTKDVGKGSGLGLSMVHGMAAQSGGGVHIRSAPGAGTTVSIYLPRASESTLPVAIQDAPEAEAADGTILLVDDDDLVRFGATAVLEEAGYTVLSADSGPAALRLLKEGAHVDALLTDYAMPGMSGAVLIADVHLLRPGLPVLLMTGYVERPSDAEGITLLKKPFKPNQLLNHLHAEIERASRSNVVRITSASA